jgi:hypothetical protein
VAKLTTDEKQRAHRGMAAATIRQLAQMVKEITPNVLDKRLQQDYDATVRGLQTLANQIEEGRVNPRRWEFLTWLHEPKVDIDFPELPVISVEVQPSGLKSGEEVSVSPSTPIPSSTHAEISSASMPPWLGEKITLSSESQKPNDG